jgi:hypothetical protein
VTFLVKMSAVLFFYKKNSFDDFFVDQIAVVVCANINMLGARFNRLIVGSINSTNVIHMK